MVNDPWGTREPPAVAELPPMPARMAKLIRRLAAGEELTADEIDYLICVEPAEFEEVANLLDEGWELVDDAPVRCLVPAAWRPAYRTWVEDRLPRVVLHTDANGQVAQASLFERDEAHAMVIEEARGAGLPAPPERRLWLLRSPWTDTSVEQILEAAEAAAGPVPGSGLFTAPDVYRSLVEIMAADSAPSA